MRYATCGVLCRQLGHNICTRAHLPHTLLSTVRRQDCSHSGKRQACGGVSLLYLAAQLLRGLRIPGQQATPAELRIRLTMAFLPLLCCLGDAVAQHSTPLSAGTVPCTLSP